MIRFTVSLPRGRKGDLVSPIRSKIEAESWLAKQLTQEGPGFWTDRESEELAEKLAQDYRPQGSKWRVKEWTQRPEGIPVYVVTRGGDLGIHSVDAREKADAIVRALNALDIEMSYPGQSG
jgi:hypothetical protein